MLDKLPLKMIESGQPYQMTVTDATGKVVFADLPFTLVSGAIHFGDIVYSVGSGPIIPRQGDGELRKIVVDGDDNVIATTL